MKFIWSQIFRPFSKFYYNMIGFTFSSIVSTISSVLPQFFQLCIQTYKSSQQFSSIIELFTGHILLLLQSKMINYKLISSTYSSCHDNQNNNIVLSLDGIKAEIKSSLYVELNKQIREKCNIWKGKLYKGKCFLQHSMRINTHGHLKGHWTTSASSPHFFSKKLRFLYH